MHTPGSRLSVATENEHSPAAQWFLAAVELTTLTLVTPSSLTPEETLLAPFALPLRSFLAGAASVTRSASTCSDVEARTIECGSATHRLPLPGLQRHNPAAVWPWTGASPRKEEAARGGTNALASQSTGDAILVVWVAFPPTAPRAQGWPGARVSTEAPRVAHSRMLPAKRSLECCPRGAAAALLQVAFALAHTALPA